MGVHKVAMLTAGGLAPCLSATVGALIEAWTATDPSVELVAYRDGYAGLLTGRSVLIGPETRAAAKRLTDLGGSPIGNSRVKLTNADDCARRGLVTPGADPLEVAARQLAADGVDVLHTIGGDDTSTTAADLATWLCAHDYPLTVVSLPKTIDNDIHPVTQSLGALTAAEQSSLYARHVMAEHSANPRMLVVHEVMGRGCGWLTAAAAAHYQRWAQEATEVPGLVEAGRWAIHGLYIPEVTFDVEAEIERLNGVMDRHGNVNLFVSEGAGVDGIVAEMARSGHDVARDPFGHPKLDTLNPGAFLADQIGVGIHADKTLVAKSGYFARSAPANGADLALIVRFVAEAVAGALEGVGGLVGQDDDADSELRIIEFERVAGHKTFDPHVEWFAQLAADIAS